MNDCIKRKVKDFTRVTEINCLKKYMVLYHDKEFIVLTDNETTMKLYLINGIAYEELIPIYPIFSISEIKEALTQF